MYHQLKSVLRVYTHPIPWKYVQAQQRPHQADILHISRGGLLGVPFWHPDDHVYNMLVGYQRF